MDMIGATTALRVIDAARDGQADAVRRIATGLKVARAADAPSLYSTAETARSEVRLNSAVGEALKLADARLELTEVSLAEVLTAMGEMRNLLVAAREPGADRAAIQGEITGLQARMASAAMGASLNAVNDLVERDTTTARAATSVISAALREGGLTFDTIDLDRSRTLLCAEDGSVFSGILDGFRTSGGTTAAVSSLLAGSAPKVYLDAKDFTSFAPTPNDWNNRVSEGMALNRRAQIVDNRLRISSGTAFFATPFELGANDDFNIRFRQHVHSGAGTGGLWGSAFMIQGEGMTARGTGPQHAMGYGNISNSVIVEFDQAGQGWDPGPDNWTNHNGLGIMRDGEWTNHLAHVNLPITINDGTVRDVWVDY